MRAVMNGVMYILSTGCQWRYEDFPPRSTLHDYFTWWICDGTLNRIHHALYVECREKVEREASPTACIIDSQSVKSAEKGGPVSILIRRSPNSRPTSKPKSSNAPIVPKGLCHYPSVGSSNVRSLEPLPPIGQGLGESQRFRFPQTRFHPPHVTKAMQSLISPRTDSQGHYTHRVVGVRSPG
jgi:transposase